MNLIAGVGLVVLSLALFFYSKPRGGQIRAFAGTHWEPYVTVAILTAFAIGTFLTAAGVLELLDLYDA